ncbi:hypothetical protein [Mesorhizobium sp. Z1-4]|uniref:hypothetical protein n=1 Tax=Mesorhizobium sp. Z1-4 TaxID=2448478 RepID=UPI000FD95B52|nr:hypothetical protein [Mesorhizobium sp. Z1-4]
MRPSIKMAIAACLLGSISWGAQAADYVHGVDASDPGACADERVLTKISHRFRHQVRHVPGLPQVEIVGYSRLGQSRYRPSDDRHPIARRYCRGTADLSDGRRRNMWYLIESRMGFVGIGSNVEFCVAGFDRWHVYGGRCRVLH